MQEQYLLEVKDLKTTFFTEIGPVTAVDGVNFTIKAGETLGVVGESGCGKSVTAESIMRLLNEQSTTYEGEINYKGKNLLQLTEQEMRNIRGNEIAMIFQDAMTSLNPVYTIGNQIAESIMIHRKLSKKEAYEEAVEMLRMTGIPAPEKRAHEYPHEISGGMRQRAMIAMALSCRPNLLIADEPTTALDVTIQAQILDVINDLKKELNMGVIMITHDLGVVAEVCTHVVVMYLGQVIEEADVETLFDQPLHPYTQGLLKCIPQLEGDRSKKLYTIKGIVPSLDNIPKGCRFAERCPYADEQCITEPPVLEEVSPRHKVRCWYYEKITKGEKVNNVATTS
ncbi:peptide/nickel transport system ATP-binding protein [Caldalkalibacillus uzonensis]|uniref:Peptide/nickel transport system ATP-binding protein n=1 Tax=Caldalkalibacillus uzonensis TaxID=353224 RepID=A0ABU0CXV0_9BACI|nr:ABC transporter ATP-binding protein [Caldalkalibacillus uzonensis]MDQ0340987.1 peptide/nickel transport system ATP-binding protein [Caldalkalibacillus uzonensis]